MSHAVVGLAWLGLATLLLLLDPAAGQSDCTAQLQAAAAGASSDASTFWVDPATPSDACTLQLCTGSYAECDVDTPPLSSLQLVFSDEFEAEGQSLAAAAGNPRWTAGHMWYSGTQDYEVYLPEQVTTANGSAVITMDRTGAQNATAPSQQPDGVVWNVSKGFKSGFVSSWNKFCFTGGYMETRLQLPGDDFASGFWPAFWLMGNLGRAGHLQTTGGFWPYSYNTCGGSDVGTEFPDGPTPQNISACPDPPGFDRTKWGLLPGQGRGAPEIDLIEVKVGPSVGRKPGDPLPQKPDQPRYPHTLLSVQSAPLLPNGTSWTDGGKPGPGQYLPKTGLPDWMWADLTFWRGAYGTTMQDRPGNLYQDTLGAYAVLDPSFWTSYHAFGLHWVPGESIRWYIDGAFVYEVNKEALRAQTNSSGYTTSERRIPVEPMAVIFNLAMSSSFSKVDLAQLPFPSQYKVDYVRVYQPPDALNIGCSPPDYPTAQYLACNRDKYLLTEAEQDLISGPCMNATSCRQEYSMDYQGGDIPTGDGTANVTAPALTAKDCCIACQNLAGCGAYTFVPAPTSMCYFKKSGGWTRAPAEGVLSGVVYDAGATYPRSTDGGTSPSPALPPPGGGGGSPPPPSGEGGGGSSSTPSPPSINPLTNVARTTSHVSRCGPLTCLLLVLLAAVPAALL